MTKNSNDSKNHIKLVKDEERVFEDLRIKYGFYAIAVCGMKTQYAIGVMSDTDECFACVGDNRESALFLYEAVISGGVTPCTLHDIVSDKQKEEYYLY